MKWLLAGRNGRFIKLMMEGHLLLLLVVVGTITLDEVEIN